MCSLLKFGKWFIWSMTGHRSIEATALTDIQIRNLIRCVLFCKGMLTPHHSEKIKYNQISTINISSLKKKNHFSTMKCFPNGEKISFHLDSDWENLYFPPRTAQNCLRTNFQGTSLRLNCAERAEGVEHVSGWREGGKKTAWFACANSGREYMGRERRGEMKVKALVNICQRGSPHRPSIKHRQALP